ncbi:hypothetical protein D3C77_536160 [compost metagenome]
MQAQFWQVRLEPAQSRDKPARQQAAGATEDKRRIGAALADFCTNPAQALKSIAAGIAQAHAGICEFKAASFFDEQRHAKMLFKHLQLAAHCAMSNMQLLGCLADTVEPGGGFKGPKGIERGQFSGA